MDKEILRQRLYAVSPFDLCSEEDDRYRDSIDMVLDKKEVVYKMPCETEAQKKAIKEMRLELYGSFNSVNIYPNGLSEVRIVCEDEIKN